MKSRIKIGSVIKEWLRDVFQESIIPENVIALNFHIQRTHDEFEIYLTGHDEYYHDHDTWLLSEVYEPKENYKGLGIDSVLLSDNEMYDIYKNEVFEFLKNKINEYPDGILYFTCRYPAGMPELLFKK